MANDIQEFITQEDTCSYLNDKKSKFHYIMINECDIPIYEMLITRGYRRFGNTFFRHMCLTCNDCKSIRIPVELFKPNKSQKRTYQKNQDIHISLLKPSINEEKLSLYNKYHKQQNLNKNWPYKEQSETEYYSSFIEGANEYGHEVTYYLNEKLVAVGLIDILPNAISSVYFYYDPELHQRSLGTFSLLTEIELCNQMNIEFLFLGYWIEKCSSMKYKANFKPHQLLLDRPNLDQNPTWQSTNSTSI